MQQNSEFHGHMEFLVRQRARKASHMKDAPLFFVFIGQFFAPFLRADQISALKYKFFQVMNVIGQYLSV